MRQLLSCAMVLAVFAASASPALAAPGDLDPSFSGDGRQLVDFGGNVDNAGGVAVQPDGKIVSAGSSRQGVDVNFGVARNNADGTPDASFSGDGRQTTNFGGGDIASAVALQPDGKIVVAGFSQQGLASRLVFALARYNSDGTPDSSFAGTGIQMTDFGGTGDASAAGVAIQADGKIVTAGTSSGPGGANVDFAVARYHANGMPDNSFSGDGRETIDFDGRSDNGVAVKVQADGRIVVAGNSGSGAGANVDFALLRFDPAGNLDPSFSGDGRQLTDFGGFLDTAGGMALQPGGKIVVSGSSDTTPSSGFAVARYNVDGTPDTSFSADGRHTTDFGGGGGPAVAVQADGRIVVAGRSHPGNFAIARFNTSGPLDSTFSGDGKQATDFGGRDDEALAVALQSDGKIVAAGYSASNPSGVGGDFALARYAGGTQPPSYSVPRPSFPFAGCAASISNVILGTAGNDTRNGTSGADRIFTRAGNDRSDGRAGNDCIHLESGADRGTGGRGNDLILGGPGRDRLSGSSGADRLSAGSGNDAVSGGSGRDRLNGGTGRDRLNGGSGSDRISGGSGSDRINARDRRRDRVDCGKGRDRVRADRVDRVARNCERVTRR
jgi:uncharacterized delta-60 repeat protein